MIRAVSWIQLHLSARRQRDAQRRLSFIICSILFSRGRVVAALGFSLYLIHDFLSKVVFNTFHSLHEDFKVVHELLLIYFRAIETDTSNVLHLGNVFDRGNGDTYLSEARQNAAAFFVPAEGIRSRATAPMASKRLSGMARQRRPLRSRVLRSTWASPTCRMFLSLMVAASFLTPVCNGLQTRALVACVAATTPGSTVKYPCVLWVLALLAFRRTSNRFGAMADCYCFDLCGDSGDDEPTIFVGSTRNVSISDPSSPWFSYANAVYNGRAPLPFELHRLNAFYQNTRNWRDLHPQTHSPFRDCDPFHEQVVCDREVCAAWRYELRDSPIEVDAIAAVNWPMWWASYTDTAGHSLHLSQLISKDTMAFGRPRFEDDEWAEIIRSDARPWFMEGKLPPECAEYDGNLSDACWDIVASWGGGQFPLAAGHARLRALGSGSM